jgi:hypothetical protein
MDASVVAAMAKWPNVPDCQGWLSLDRRGKWRLQGNPVAHAGLSEFIGRNYVRHESGAWFMQNGPQRVWVSLDVAPWVLHLEGDGSLRTHTGMAAGEISAAWLVDGESLCLMCEHGLGVVDDRDLPALLEHILRPDGGALEEMEDAAKGKLIFRWQETTLPLKQCADCDLPVLGDFRRSP